MELDSSEKYVKENRESLGKLKETKERMIDVIICHKATEKDLKTRAAESLAAKANNQPQAQPSKVTKKEL